MCPALSLVVRGPPGGERRGTRDGGRHFVCSPREANAGLLGGRTHAEASSSREYRRPFRILAMGRSYALAVAALAAGASAQIDITTTASSNWKIVETSYANCQLTADENFGRPLCPYGRGVWQQRERLWDRRQRLPYIGCVNGHG